MCKAMWTGLWVFRAYSKSKFLLCKTFSTQVHFIQLDGAQYLR